MVDPHRLRAAYEKARDDLLDERVQAGHWVGELASSALSTATAISAMSLMQRQATLGQHSTRVPLLIRAGLRYLASQQNADGGWGDTDKSLSNIATTMLGRAAFHLAGSQHEYAPVLQRAEHCVEAQGGIAGLRRRYGKDKTFAVPILTNCALAGLVSWTEVAALPFELACVPQRLYRFLKLPVVSYAIPALVAIGQASYFHRKPRNPITRLVRAAAVARSLNVVTRMQPTSGGFLEATPLTSFVVMSLASIGRGDHPIAQRGLEFLIDSARDDGSWPIDTDLATWNTTLALNALGEAGEDVTQLDCLPWLLSCQHRVRHAFTGADPGGWGWSDLSGAVPDADDTPGAMLALAKTAPRDPEVIEAAIAGIRWLLSLQNRDGGWPTFCRGWGALPFDRSAADLTAHAVRALHAWHDLLVGPDRTDRVRQTADGLPATIKTAINRGLRYLAEKQRGDGSWLPLWFGNQHHAEEENPIYGTAKVLLAYRDLGLLSTVQCQRGATWLAARQNADGGWGDGEGLPLTPDVPCGSSVEETALAVEALASLPRSPAMDIALENGLAWLVQAVEEDCHKTSTPIGFYFAKLWYYEKLYPLSFSVSALGSALQRLHPRLAQTAATAHLANP